METAMGPQPRQEPLEHFPGEPDHVFPEPVDRYLDWLPVTHMQKPRDDQRSASPAVPPIAC